MTRIITYIFAFTALFLLSGCGNQSGTSDSQSEALDTILKPDSELLGATIYLYDKEKVTAEVKADKILKFEVKDSTMAYILDIDILDSAGTVSTKIVGDSGIIREKDSYLQIYGNVVVVTEDSTVLETDHLRWDSRTDRIKTDAFVRIIKDNDIITGWGLDTDHSLNSIKILDRVSGEIKNPEKLKDE